MRIDDFKDKIGGGVRPSLFRVGGRIGASGNDTATSFLVTASALPASNIGEVTAPYRGRNIKLPTSRTFEDWSVTILSDKDMRLRSKFEQWLEDLNGAEDNLAERQIELNNATDFPDWSVDQLDRAGEPIKSYTFKYCFPKSISEITVDATNEDLASFTVTLGYSYFITSDVNVGYGTPGNRTTAL
tara:strand:- start:3004 stop:3561 length:558 start_codon:yes stop_codon:yes gene_type:complete